MPFSDFQIKKLTEAQEQELCELYPMTRTKSLAAKYNVSSSTIRNIVIRRGFKMKPVHSGATYSFDKHFFNNIDSEEKAYVLGFYYADGCLYEPTYRLITELQERDRDILEKIKKALKSNHPLTVWTRKSKKSGKSNNYLTLTLASHEFIASCKRVGLTERKSLTLKFPTKDQVPNHLVRHFIRGYFDGDGSVTAIEYPHVRRVGTSIISTWDFNLRLSDIVMEHIGQKVGMLINNKTTKGLSYFRTAGIRRTLLFLDWLYKDSTIYLDRKYTKYLFIKSISKDWRRRKDCSSRYFGVQKYRDGKFAARFFVKGSDKSKHLGAFDTQEEAARAYDDYCIANGVNLDKLNFS